MANLYVQTLEKTVKVEDNGVKDGFVFPAVILGVAMFICGVIVIACVVAKMV